MALRSEAKIFQDNVNNMTWCESEDLASTAPYSNLAYLQDTSNSWRQEN